LPPPPPPPPAPGGWDGRDWKEWGRNLGDDIRNRTRQDWGRRPHTPHHLLIGMIIVAVGVLLLLQNLGFPFVHILWQFWPVILIALGLTRILENRSPAGLVWGLVVAGIGAIFLLDHFGIHIDFGVIWPVFVIGFGLSLLARNFARGGPAPRPWVGGPGVSGSATISVADFHLWALFGGGRRRIDSKQFRGGDVVCIFGGYQIDLRDAVMAENKAVIDANAMFGGVEIWVPQNWTVEVVGHGIFGGYDDKTLPPRISPADKPQHLLLTGYAMFGGVTVKN